MKKNIFSFFFLAFIAILAFDYNSSQLQDKLWSETKSIDVTDKSLLESSINPTKVMVVSRAPMSVKQGVDGSYVYDFGRTIFGTLEIETDVSGNFEFEMFEKLDEKLSVDNQFSLGYFKGRESITKKMVVSLPQRNLPLKTSLPSSIEGVIPFRFVKLITDVPISSFTLKQLMLKFDAGKPVTKFYSSNDMLNRLWTLSTDTIESTSFSGIFVDGNRERQPYEADAYLSALAQHAMYADSTLARNSLAYLADKPSAIIEWAFLYTSLVREVFLQTGDREFLGTEYENIISRLFLDKLSDFGLLKVVDKSGNYQLTLNGVRLEPIIDWPPAERLDFATVKIDFFSKVKLFTEILARYMRGSLYYIYGLEYLSNHQFNKVESLFNQLNPIEPNNFVVNAFFYNSLLDAAFLANEIGRRNDSKEFTSMAKILKNTLRRVYYDEKVGLFTDDVDNANVSFHSNLIALNFGIADASDSAVLDYVEKNKYRASVYSGHFLLNVLFNNGLYTEALQYLTDYHPRSWTAMLRDDETVSTEVWNSSLKPDMDWTHAWGATPGYHIIRNIVGVTSLTPGYEEILVDAPDVSTDFFTAEISTPRGVLRIDLFSKDGGKKLGVDCSALSDGTKVFLRNDSDWNGDFQINSKPFIWPIFEQDQQLIC